MDLKLGKGILEIFKILFMYASFPLGVAIILLNKG